MPKSLHRLKTAGQPWQLQTAKARFSEVFRKARTEGPQLITRQGKEGVVMPAKGKLAERPYDEDEARAIRLAEEEYARGETVSLEVLQNDLGLPTQ